MRYLIVDAIDLSVLLQRRADNMGRRQRKFYDASKIVALAYPMIPLTFLHKYLISILSVYECFSMF